MGRKEDLLLLFYKKFIRKFHNNHLWKIGYNKFILRYMYCDIFKVKQKDGKEQGQGVAYLDDGTMIVVEGGHKHLNETLEVVVTSVLQTAAGRMIFAKPK